MHHGILLKVNGDNLEHATEQADRIIEKTIRCNKCESSVNGVNWDYYTNCGQVDKKWIKEHRSDADYSTVKGMEKHYIELRKDSLKNRNSRLLEALDKFNRVIKETGEVPRYSMLDYYYRKIVDIRFVIAVGNAGEGLYELHCTDNHFADMTSYTDKDSKKTTIYTEGKKVFYLWYDRHYY